MSRVLLVVSDKNSNLRNNETQPSKKLVTNIQTDIVVSKRHRNRRAIADVTVLSPDKIGSIRTSDSYNNNITGVNTSPAERIMLLRVAALRRYALSKVRCKTTHLVQCYPLLALFA
jgi:hypothetical protein